MSAPLTWTCDHCGCVLGSTTEDRQRSAITAHMREHCPRLTGQVKNYSELELTDYDKKLLTGMLIQSRFTEPING